jgi:hypothetical protein
MSRLQISGTLHDFCVNYFYLGNSSHGWLVHPFISEFCTAFCVNGLGSGRRANGSGDLLDDLLTPAVCEFLRAIRQTNRHESSSRTRLYYLVFSISFAPFLLLYQTRGPAGRPTGASPFAQPPHHQQFMHHQQQQQHFLQQQQYQHQQMQQRSALPSAAAASNSSSNINAAFAAMAAPTARALGGSAMPPIASRTANSTGSKSTVADPFASLFKK